jgi:hypothetical protein
MTMNEPFELPVDFRNEEVLFPARLVKRGYYYKMEVEVKGQTLVFEPDEEGCWRALLESSVSDNNKQDRELLEAIRNSIEFLMR